MTLLEERLAGAARLLGELETDVLSRVERRVRERGVREILQYVAPRAVVKDWQGYAVVATRWAEYQARQRGGQWDGE